LQKADGDAVWASATYRRIAANASCNVSACTTPIPGTATFLRSVGTTAVVKPKPRGKTKTPRLPKPIFQSRHRAHLPGQRNLADRARRTGNRFRFRSARQRGHNRQIATRLTRLTAGDCGNVQVVGQQIDATVTI